MAVASNGAPENRPGRRALELLPVGLASLARLAPSAASGPAARDAHGARDARDDESERVLRAAVDALLGLARRTPGFDVTVTVNQSPPRAVRLRYTNEGLVAHRLAARGRSGPAEDVGPVLDESEVVSELASMLLAGEV